MSRVRIKILIDTSSGILPSLCDKYAYEVIGLPFLLDDIEYNDLSIDCEDFYLKLKSANKVHTSQASIDVVTRKIKEVLEDSDEVLYFPITSGLSSAISTANLIIEQEGFGDRVFIVDHRTISVPEERLLDDVRVLIDKGLSAKEIKDIVESRVQNSIWITVDNFDYLRKGGRVNTAVATLGNLLNIKPILFSDGGKFQVVKKDRSLKKSLDIMTNLAREELGNEIDKLGSKWLIDVAYTENLDLANELKEKIHKEFSYPLDMIRIGELPKVVACHTGPNTIGTALYKCIGS